ncbi:hypothetical protein GDO81_017498 [Engystomops pustulosus]|uniref:Uncharacterized protein n=1 Tax=Engystomops pustulosus TaxID=76066 RepID=A0AAV7AKG5_ENGPU|nr:hypothetical protein GDO81_017498 [Engystomops pustulosus]
MKMWNLTLTRKNLPHCRRRHDGKFKVRDVITYHTAAPCTSLDMTVIYPAVPTLPHRGRHILRHSGLYRTGKSVNLYLLLKV